MAIAFSLAELSPAGRQLRQLAAGLGRAPRQIDVYAAWQKGQAPHPRAVVSEFGGIKAANTQLGIYQLIELERLMQLAERLGRRPTTRDIQAARKLGGPSIPKLNYYFGGITAACQLADIPQTRPAYPSRFELLQELRQLAEHLQRRPTNRDLRAAFREGHCHSDWTFRQVFGSYTAAVQQSRVDELDCVKEAQAKRLQQLRRARAKRSRAHWRNRRRNERRLVTRQLVELGLRLGRAPSRSDVNRASRQGQCVKAWTMGKLFGNFSAAVNQSGIHRILIVTQLQKLAVELGRPPTQDDVMEASKQGRCYSTHTIRRFFGDYHAAASAAGFDTRQCVNRDDDRLLQDLRRLSEEIGRVPTPGDINAGNRRQVCAHKTTYIRRFGSVSEALKAAGLVT